MEDKMSELEEEVKRLRDELKNLKNHLQGEVSPQNNKNQQNEHLISSEVEVNSVGEIEMKIEENTVDLSPMTLLPVELRLYIFKNLDFNSLKNARLVSQSWNIEATHILSDCSQINLNRFFDSGSKDARKWMFPKNITPGLIKFIHAPNNSDDNGCICRDMQKMINMNRYTNTRMTQLTEFCKKYSYGITGIKVDGEGYDYREVMKNLRRVLIKCEKLENLHLYSLQHDINVQKNSRKLKKGFPKILPSLKFIQLEFYWEWEIDRCKYFLDKIFKASENLEVLNISGPYCPDLSNNRKLKKLVIYPDRDRAIIPQINKMIEQTSSSLETVKLLVESPDSDSSDDEDFDNADFLSFPSSMSQLKVFINKDLNIFRMHSSVSLLLNFENLQTLKLANSDTMITEVFFKGVTPQFAHLKLKNLQIDEIENESILERICEIFPNLKKIDFAVGEIRISNGETVELEKFVINCFEICSNNTKLVDITVTMQLDYDLFAITEILLESNSKLFAGTRTLTFANRTGKGFRRYLFHLEGVEIDKFQNSLLLARSLKMLQLKNFTMKAAVAAKIAEFVMKNNLSVRFID